MFERIANYSALSAVPGDDLFSPFERQGGLPIGNLTSRFFGNVYLNPMDHYIKERMRCRGFLRYVDGFALFSDITDQLNTWRIQLNRNNTSNRNNNTGFRLSSTRHGQSG